MSATQPAVKRVRTDRQRVRPRLDAVRVRVVYAAQDDQRGFRALVDVIRGMLG